MKIKVYSPYMNCMKIPPIPRRLYSTPNFSSAGELLPLCLKYQPQRQPHSLGLGAPPLGCLCGKAALKWWYFFSFFLNNTVNLRI